MLSKIQPLLKAAFTSQEVSVGDATEDSIPFTLRRASGDPVVLQFKLTNADEKAALTSVAISSDADHALSLQDIGRLLGGQSVSGSVPPADAGFPGFDSTLLRSIEITFAPSRLPKLDALFGIEVGVAFSNEWKACGDRVRFHDLGIWFNWERSPSRVWANFVGDAEIVGAPFHAELSVPDLRFQCALQEGSELDLGSLLRDVAPDIFDSTEIKCDSLQFSGAPREKEFSFHGSLKDVWKTKIGNGEVAIEECSLGASVMTTGTKGMVAGTLKLGDLELHGSASVDTAQKDWAFNTQAVIEDGLTLPKMFTALGGHFNFTHAVPEILNAVALNSLELSFRSLTHEFHAGISTTVMFAGAEADAIVTCDLLPKEGSEKQPVKIAGNLKLWERWFDVIYGTGESANVFIAASPNKGPALDVGQVVSRLAGADQGESTAANQNYGLAIKDALVAYVGGKFLFTADIDFSLDLSGLGKLPLIGAALSGASKLAVSFQPIVSSKGSDGSKVLTADELAAIGNLAPEGGPQVPDKATGGFEFITTLQLGELSRKLDLGVPTDQLAQSGGPVGPPSQATTLASPIDPGGQLSSPDNKVQWIELQKSFGPVHLGRAGFGFNDGKIAIVLDGSISAGPLVIGLEGLGAEYGLSDHSLSFRLDGLALEFKRDPLEITGAFLRLGDDFAGKVSIATSKFKIDALGAYGEHNGQPSLFVYAFLDYPLGGPVFFFVEGLALGFGYNRRLVVPPIDQIATFPLVSEAMGTATPAPGLTGTGGGDFATAIRQELTTLERFIPPTPGEYFIAVGVKFSSFKLIDSFALLVVNFGRGLEFDLLGVSTLIVPGKSGTSIPTIAEIEMQFSVKFDPIEGFLEARAGLTPKSYILSPSCRLHGDFAFNAWFRGPHAGDFLVTVGGYHPHYHPPAHYPQNLKPLGFDWRISSSTQISGGAYYALTPSAVMAGCSLDATYDIGWVRAWFDAGADFLISWKPFHYEASFHVEIGAQVTIHFFGTHHIGITAGAEVSIWGPEFAGHASVHVKVLVVPVSFTVTLGSGGRPSTAAIGWDDFRASYLPANPETSVCSLHAVDGVVGKVPTANGKERWIINAKDFAVATDSLMPLSVRCEGDTGSQPKQLGIKPMGRPAGAAKIGQSIKVTKAGAGDASDDFEFTQVPKSYPAALWSEDASPQTVGAKLNGVETVEGLGGYRLSAKKPPQPGKSHFIENRKLQYAPSFPTLEGPGGEPLKVQVGTQQTLADAMKSREAETRRNTLLEDLGFDPLADVDLAESLPRAFTRQPQHVVMTA